MIISDGSEDCIIIKQEDSFIHFHHHASDSSATMIRLTLSEARRIAELLNSAVDSASPRISSPLPDSLNIGSASTATTSQVTNTYKIVTSEERSPTYIGRTCF